MAEVEYKGLKVGGSQWLIILPLLGSIVGGLWGGFQLYDRLLDAEATLAKVNPVTIIAEVEKPLLKLALQATRGNQAKCAKMLGINRNTLRKKISEQKLDKK